MQNSPSILIAEDNPDSRDALRTLLEAYGFRVTEAENGEEAVRKALTIRPDLILMDIMMPIMDGLEATKRLRGTAEMAKVPIVALTAMAGSQDLAMDAGCDAYLTKPIDIPRFLGTIRSYLEPNGPIQP
ncbi:MAG TPA: response regulator [Longimicrobiaceae bacterium]|nr:response regulator [Longimicrobiaceae bacterium]